MPGKRKPKVNPGVIHPEFRRIPLAAIVEPQTPARATMHDGKLQELVESMRALGQLEPVTVERRNGSFEIITGHRRYLAARELQWPELAAMVYAEGTAQTAAMMVHENTVREDMNPAEEALFMAQVREKLQLDEAGLMRTFHRSADYIAGRFALLRGDPEIFGALQRGEIRLGVAHELNRIDAADMRRYYLDCARRGDPPARVVRQWVESWRGQQQPTLSADVAAVVESVAAASGGEATTVGAESGAANGGGSAAPAPYRLECGLCGGHKDPYNLINVWVHKWHWEQILSAVNKPAAEGEQT